MYYNIIKKNIMTIELTPLIKYQILNEIHPCFQKTAYPYNYWSLEKIIETKKKIKLVWSKDKKFLTIPSKEKKGGNEIYIYIL